MFRVIAVSMMFAAVLTYLWSVTGNPISLLGVGFFCGFVIHSGVEVLVK